MSRPPLSIRLSDRAYAIYEAEANARGQRVGQVIRAAVEQGALALRRARIRTESARVAERYRTDPEVRAFYDGVAAAGAEAIGPTHDRDLARG